MPSRRREVTWDEVEQLAHKLCEICEMIERPLNSILPVTRGGLVPAAIMSYRLKLPIISVVNLNMVSLGSMFSFLIVDDVCDTGRTFRMIRDGFPNSCLAALFAKPDGLAYCDACSELVDQEVWLSFPWAPNDEVNR